MKKFAGILIVLLILGAAGSLLESRYHIFKGHVLAAPGNAAAAKDVYYCPMHPTYTSDKPGDCPICGMRLVKKEETARSPEKQVLYYRNPMDPKVTSPVPMKDPMGMDYVPVYGPEGPSSQTAAPGGIYISPERLQLVGMKQEKVLKRHLVREVATVGRIAYDPGLYLAQKEYLQALKAREETAASDIALVKEQMSSLVEAAQQRLRLLGMDEEGIKTLVKEGRAQENLYLPGSEESVWVYMTIYEQDMGAVKEGQAVEVEAVAFPGETFEGKIVALTPVLDPMTRSVQARAEVKDLQHRLKPEMYVNVKIDVYLGEKLSVSEEAVIPTGQRTLVVVSKGDGTFTSRDVKVGQKAQGFYEVLDGLSEGENVVTSGNFLIDSESRLQGSQQ